MPTSTKVPTMQKPQRAGRETSWGMLSLDALVEMPSSAVLTREKSNGMRERTHQLPKRAIPVERSSLKERESSWGMVDVLSMLDDLENGEQDATVPPPMPPKGSFATTRDRSRTRPSIKILTKPDAATNIDWKRRSFVCKMRKHSVAFETVPFIPLVQH